MTIEHDGGIRRCLGAAQVAIVVACLVIECSHAQTITPADGPLRRLVDQERREPNRVARRALLQMIANRSAYIVGSRPTEETTVRLWATEFFVANLEDQSPLIVEASIYALSNHFSSDLSKRMESLFANATSLYPGYSERIKTAIVYDIRVSKCVEAAAFLAKELNGHNGRTLEHDILNTLRELGEVSVLQNVIQYEQRMRRIVGARNRRGANPMIYSHEVINADIAREVINSLQTNSDTVEIVSVSLML